MKVKVLLIILLTLMMLLSAEQVSEDRGATTNVPRVIGRTIDGIASPGAPVSRPETEQRTALNREGWEVVDSIAVNNVVGVNEYFGVKYSAEGNFLEKITNVPPLTNSAKIALQKAPAWMKPNLENKFSLLTDNNQNIWANVILNAVDPYIDEIAYSIMHLPAAWLQSNYASPELINHNAELLYTIQAELPYVQIVDHGNSASDDFYSTTSYLTRDEAGNTFSYEIPREVYYMNVVLPRAGVEIPGYINPGTVESNSSHNNNIVDSDEGVFWREWLYYHTDEGLDEHDEVYENLRILMMNSEVLYDPTSQHSTDSAMGNLTDYINDALVFGSGSERPHQPVRIYRKHLGRCGEHSDLRSAMAKTALIPIRKISTYSTDHIWNEFYNDEEWVHWDETQMDYPMMYEWGWGKVHASVMVERGDGVFTSISDKYSGGSATLSVYVVDSNQNPIDGAKVLLTTENEGSWIFDNFSVTNNEGRAEFVVGESRSYAALVDSPIGDTGIMLLVENVEDGYFGEYTITVSGTVPALDYTVLEVPGDSTEDFILAVEYSSNYNHKITTTAFNGSTANIDITDIVGDSYNYYTPEGSLNFFMMDGDNFNSYQGNSAFAAFNSETYSTSSSTDFEIPTGDDYYAFWDNSSYVGNSQRVLGSIKLLRYDDNGGMATLSGSVTELFDMETIAGAEISAGIYSTVTDAAGNFSLEIYPGVYNVLCQADGFAAALYENFEVSQGEVDDIPFYLWENSYNPADITAVELENGNASVSWNAPLRAPETRDLTSYDVHRLKLDDEFNVVSTEAIASGLTQTNYEDITWTDIEAGSYKFMVIANYTSSISSPGGSSNLIYNNMMAEVTVDLFTNSGDAADGAYIEISNLNQNPMYVYSSYANSESVTFPQIWKGEYNVSVSLAGFDSFEISELDISDDTNIQAVLQEQMQLVDGAGVFDYQLSWGKVDTDNERGFIEYNVFVDDFSAAVLTTTATVYDLSSYGDDFHEAGVQAVFTTGNSDIMIIGFIGGESLPVNMVAHYTFDNPEAPYSDELGNYNAAGSGNVTVVESEIGGSAAMFDGSAATYVDCGDIEELDGVSAYSMGGWFNLTQWVQWRKMITKDAKIGLITQDNNTTGKLQACQRNPEGNMRGDGETLIRLNEWHHVYTTFDGTRADNKSRLKLYVDGVEVELEFFMDIPEITSPDLENFWIGGYTNNSITGRVDEVQVWDRTITKKEIQHLYLNSAPYWSSVEGTVTADGDGAANASVSLGMFETVTDAEGAYSMEVPATRYNARCDVNGFDPVFMENFKVLADETYLLDFSFTTVGSEDDIFAPAVYALNGNYPNPFNPSTTISYSIAADTAVELIIFNLKGQKIKTLVKKQQSAGKHAITWLGKDDSHKTVSSGIYFYKLKASNYTEMKKMILMK